jgi:hypothetical protein
MFAVDDIDETLGGLRKRDCTGAYARAGFWVGATCSCPYDIERRSIRERVDPILTESLRMDAALRSILEAARPVIAFEQAQVLLLETPTRLFCACELGHDGQSQLRETRPFWTIVEVDLDRTQSFWPKSLDCRQRQSRNPMSASAR